MSLFNNKPLKEAFKAAAACGFLTGVGLTMGFIISAMTPPSFALFTGVLGASLAAGITTYNHQCDREDLINHTHSVIASLKEKAAREAQKEQPPKVQPKVSPQA